LRWTDLSPKTKPEQVEHWRTVWQRRVPQYPYPLKLVSGSLFVRVIDYVQRMPSTRTLNGFQPIWDEFPLYRWLSIEDQADGLDFKISQPWDNHVESSWRTGTNVEDLEPKLPAIVFCADGKIKQHIVDIDPR
jgi:hypothetical protein